MKGTVITNAISGLNMRSRPEATAQVICVLPNGTKLEAIAMKGAWLYASKGDNVKGWVHSSHVRCDGTVDGLWDSVKDIASKVANTVKSAVSGAKTAVEAEIGTMYVTAQSGLRLREKPSTTAADLNDTQPFGTAVTLMSGGAEATGWAHVKTRTGKTGYMSTQYLSNSAPNATPTTTTGANSGTFPTGNQYHELNDSNKMTLTENVKKYIKYGVIGLVGGGLAYGIYKAVTSKGSDSGSTPAEALPAPRKKGGSLNGLGGGKKKRKPSRKSGARRNGAKDRKGAYKSVDF